MVAQQPEKVPVSQKKKTRAGSGLTDSQERAGRKIFFTLYHRVAVLERSADRAALRLLVGAQTVRRRDLKREAQGRTLYVAIFKKTLERVAIGVRFMR